MVDQVKEPFVFCTRLYLPELTGLKASTIGQLLELIKQVPNSCIYHHTHRFLLQHQFLSPEPPNDFAYWVTAILGEDELGEKLSSIDTIQYPNIHELREAIARTIQNYTNKDPSSAARYSRRGGEFHFIKSVSFIFSTNYVARDLNEFLDILKNISIESIYFHIFDARLRLERGVNDFSRWFENSVGDKYLADRVSKLDPYTYTLEELRKTIIKLIEKRMPKKDAKA